MHHTKHTWSTVHREFPHFVVCQQYMTAQIWDFDWVEPITKMQFAPLNNAPSTQGCHFQCSQCTTLWMHACCMRNVLLVLCCLLLLIALLKWFAEANRVARRLWYAVCHRYGDSESRIFEFEWRRWRMSHIEQSSRPIYYYLLYCITQLPILPLLPLLVCVQVSFDCILSALFAFFSPLLSISCSGTLCVRMCVMCMCHFIFASYNR